MSLKKVTDYIKNKNIEDFFKFSFSEEDEAKVDVELTPLAITMMEELKISEKQIQTILKKLLSKAIKEQIEDIENLKENV